MNTQLGNPKAKHLYEVQTYLYDYSVNRAQHLTVEVHANNRTQAAAVAKREGYVVASVNMVG
jgi:hypothetical protein